MFARSHLLSLVFFNIKHKTKPKYVYALDVNQKASAITHAHQTAQN